MKNKLGNVCMLFILGLSLAGSAWAMENAQKGGPVGLNNTGLKNSSEMSAEFHDWRMGGIVSAVDPQNRTIAIHQETVHHDWVRQWKVDEKVAKELFNIKPGDLVNVWGKGKVVTDMKKVS